MDRDIRHSQNLGEQLLRWASVSPSKERFTLCAAQVRETLSVECGNCLREAWSPEAARECRTLRHRREVTILSVGKALKADALVVCGCCLLHDSACPELCSLLSASPVQSTVRAQCSWRLLYPFHFFQSRVAGVLLPCCRGHCCAKKLSSWTIVRCSLSTNAGELTSGFIQEYDWALDTTAQELECDVAPSKIIRIPKVLSPIFADP